MEKPDVLADVTSMLIATPEQLSHQESLLTQPSEKKLKHSLRKKEILVCKLCTRNRLEALGLSDNAATTIMLSWQQQFQKVYNVYLSK